MSSFRSNYSIADRAYAHRLYIGARNAFQWSSVVFIGPYPQPHPLPDSLAQIQRLLVISQASSTITVACFQHTHVSMEIPRHRMTCPATYDTPI